MLFKALNLNSFKKAIASESKSRFLLTFYWSS